MATYLLDTNHASKLISPDDALWTKADAAIDRGDEIVVPLDVVEEIQYGIEGTPDPVLRVRRQRDLDDLLPLLHAAVITPEEAVESGLLRGRLKRSGRRLETIDAHLAAMAKLRGWVLVTTDRDFAPLVGEIEIENRLEQR